MVERGFNAKNHETETAIERMRQLEEQQGANHARVSSLKRTLIKSEAARRNAAMRSQRAEQVGANRGEDMRKHVPQLESAVGVSESARSSTMESPEMTPGSQERTQAL